MYSLTKLMSLLLMPRHQQPWDWPSYSIIFQAIHDKVNDKFPTKFLCRKWPLGLETNSFPPYHSRYGGHIILVPHEPFRRKMSLDCSFHLVDSAVDMWVLLCVPVVRVPANDEPKVLGPVKLLFVHLRKKRLKLSKDMNSHLVVLAVNYGISNITVLEIP